MNGHIFRPKNGVSDFSALWHQIYCRAWQSRKDTRDSDSSSRNIQASPERKAAQTKTSLHLLRKSAPEDAPVADLKRLWSNLLSMMEWLIGTYKILSYFRD